MDDRVGKRENRQEIGKGMTGEKEKQEGERTTEMERRSDDKIKGKR